MKTDSFPYNSMYIMFGRILKSSESGMFPLNFLIAVLIIQYKLLSLHFLKYILLYK
mgnify:CR=1 FL=1